LRSRGELFEAIRRDARREELSIRALAERHGVHRRTVREALRSAVSAPRKPRTAQAPKLDPVRAVIDDILQMDLDAPRKQRHTARRIHGRLLAEHGAAGLSYSAVRDYVRRRRPEIAAAAGRARPAAFILQDHAPGAEAEVDFGEVWVELAGERTKCFLFAFRLSFSGKPCIGCSLRRVRRRLSKATCTRSPRSVGCLPGTFATTTCARRCRGCCSVVTGASQSIGSRSGRTKPLFP